MKFSQAWLRECVAIDADTDDLVARLTMAGLEVDSIEPAVAEVSGVVVALITAVAAHPDAENLKVCEVACGAAQSVQIVCGAPNARAGLKVALATVGARLPGGLLISQAQLRGVESLGMLCSSAEIGLSEDDAGLLELPEDALVGVDLRDYLGLNDNIIEVDLTPNRGDCLSLLGLAREVGVLYDTAYSVAPCEAVAPTIDEVFPVALSAQSACPRYAGRVIRDIDITQPTPTWMQEKLRRSGIRSIDAVVDVTNYVMLELGQPMHAFDLAALREGINVRFAKEGEKLTLLDGSELALDADSLLITDQSGPLALAGIMGGAGSGVAVTTTDIFLESAHFNPLSLAGKARQYGLHTDSSHRFERGVDPELPVRAMERATALLLAITGGRAGPVSVTECTTQLPVKSTVLLRRARLIQQLKVDLGDAGVAGILDRLGIMVTETNEQGWLCTVPTWRFDVAIEADLIEEIARIYGYNNLPVATVKMPLNIEPVSECLTPLNRIKSLLSARDYLEAITYSFVDERLQARVNPGIPAVQLANPISADMGVMRTSLITGLLLALKYNTSRQQSRVRLFETGQRFIHAEPLIQQDMVAGVITGGRGEKSWAGDDTLVDFYDIKGDVEAVLTLTGTTTSIMFKLGEHPCLQPGQSATILDSGMKTIGYIGKLHPGIKLEMGLNEDVFLFEMQLDAINAGVLPKFADISKFPGVRRDIALLVDSEIAYSELRHTVEKNAGDYLSDLKVFDVYHGKHLENNRKSVAIGLTFQHKSRTLTDAEVNSAMDMIITALKSECLATLRG